MIGLWRRLTRRLRPMLPAGTAGKQAAAGLVLLAVAMVAMALANSPCAAGWQRLLDGPLTGFSSAGDWDISLNRHFPKGLTFPHSPRGWINEGLMAIFFFAIGLEIKREVLVGDLAHAATRRLPVLAAAAGMAGPALVFTLVALWLEPQWLEPHAASASGAILRGWAIPAATDIAFALGVMGLLGHRVPASLRLFLLTVAVVDDLGATAIIALAYAGPMAWIWLGAGALLLLTMAGLNLAGCRRALPYVVLAMGLWACVLASGLHPTVAGVLAAITIPMTVGAQSGPHAGRSLLLRMEHALAPWSAFAIVPLFALANAGVAIGGESPGSILPSPAAIAPLTLAVAAGLVLGKQLGVMGAVWLAARSGLALRPRGASWMQLWGVSLLCGIGFTMSLLIATLAFPLAPALAAQARLGIIAGSLISAVMGFGVLRLAAGKGAQEASPRH